MDFTIIIIFAAIVLVGLLLRKQRKPLSFPGPQEWPFVGCFFEMRRQNRVQLLTNWAKRYGAAYQLSLFGKRYLVVSHPDTINEVLVSKGKAFGGRPITFQSKEMNLNNLVDSSNVAYNTIVRKHVHPSLNTFGAGRGKMAAILNASTRLLMNNFEKAESKPFDPKNSIYEATTMTVALLVYGDDVGDTARLSRQLFNENLAHIQARTSNIGNVLLTVAPWLRHLPWFPPYERVVRCKSMQEEVYGAVIKRLKEISKDSKELTLGKALLDAVGQQFGKGDEAGEITTNHVQMIIRDIMTAGVLTTSNSFHALVDILQHHQDIQDKAYQEILTRVGVERAVKIDDKDILPYNRAVVLEILRYFTAATIGIPHRAIEDTTLRGTLVPRDTEVITNLWACHHDPDLWADPMTFRPERFLDDDGQLVPPDHTNRKQLFPFGAGTRVCVGEVIALNRLFLFLTNCLQKFHFVPPEGADATTCDAKSYYLQSALESASYKTRAMPRNRI